MDGVLVVSRPRNLARRTRDHVPGGRNDGELVLRNVAEQGQQFVHAHADADERDLAHQCVYTRGAITSDGEGHPRQCVDDLATRDVGPLAADVQRHKRQYVGRDVQDPRRGESGGA